MILSKVNITKSLTTNYIDFIFKRYYNLISESKTYSEGDLYGRKRRKRNG